MPDPDRTAVLKARADQLRTLGSPWEPTSEKLRELWTRWEWDTASYPHAAPRDRLCPRCAHPNPAGSPQTAWLCYGCLCDVQREDGPHLNGHAPKPECQTHNNLLAVAKLLAQPFPLAKLAVYAWRRDQQRWGLAGFETEYPDVHKVLCALHSRGGLLSQGALVKVGVNTFEVAKGK